MWDYLLFNKFIAQDLLIFVYYIGVFVLPFILWWNYQYIIQKFIKIKNLYIKQLAFKDKIKIYIAFFILFFCMQICWRIFFEAMIGYFDIHNYLYKISTSF